MVRFERSLRNVAAEHGAASFDRCPAGYIAHCLARGDEVRAVQVGYKFHHLSNLYTAPANPGLDGNAFFAGFSWTLRRARDDAAAREGA